MTEETFPDVKVAENRILVVEDEEPVSRLIGRILERGGFEFDVAASAAEAVARLERGNYALVLTDMNMPGTSGLDLLGEIQRRWPTVGTVMVTGEDSADLADRAIRLGAYGYILKPFRHNEVIINAGNALRRRALEMENQAHRERLEEMVRTRSADLWQAVTSLEEADRELRSSYEETVRRLSLAAEFRDDETALHIQRMSRYTGLIAANAGLPAETVEKIRMASIMHDIGKIGIPDEILRKQGKFTPEERKVMQGHAEIGYSILSGTRSELLTCAATIALTHHERVDGTGYPRGLSDDEIPLEGRIAAIADVFDALTSARVYKDALSVPKAVAIMEEERNRHFDSKLLDVFLDHMNEALAIMTEAADPIAVLTPTG